jgi:hypothetical protein
VSQYSELCRHNPLCCFSTSVYFCKLIFRYRLSPKTFGYTFVMSNFMTYLLHLETLMQLKWRGWVTRSRTRNSGTIPRPEPLRSGPQARLWQGWADCSGHMFMMDFNNDSRGFKSTKELIDYLITSPFHPEDGGRKVIRNVGVLPHGITTHKTWTWSILTFHAIGSVRESDRCSKCTAPLLDHYVSFYCLTSA